MLSIVFFSGTLVSEVLAEEFTFLHMWDSPAVKKIGNEISDLGYDFKSVPVGSNFNGLRSEIIKRKMNDDMPEAVQWILGKELGVLVEGGFFNSIPEDQISSSSIYRTEVYDVIKNDKGIIGLPLAIHSLNHIIFNHQLLHENNYEIPTSWMEFLKIAPDLHKNGLTPLAISNQAWQLRSWFLSVLSSQLSHHELKSFLSSAPPSSVQKKALYKTFEIMLGFKPYFNHDYHDLSWLDVSEKVTSGHAVAQALGDFATQRIPANLNFRCQISPQSQSILWAVEMVAFPRSSDNKKREKQTAFMQTMSKPTALNEYVTLKGGITPHQKNDHYDTHPCLSSVIKQWHSNENKIWLDGGDLIKYNDIGLLAERLFEDEHYAIENAVADTFALVNKINHH